MPATKKRPPSRTQKKTTTSQLAKELAAVKTEVAHLQDKCQRLNRTLIRLVWPEKWNVEHVDDEILWEIGIQRRSFQKWLATLGRGS